MYSHAEKVKELVMTTEDDKNFHSSTKWWICDNVFVEGDVNIRDHCYITGKYECVALRDSNVENSLNYKISTMFQSKKRWCTLWKNVANSILK